MTNAQTRLSDRTDNHHEAEVIDLIPYIARRIWRERNLPEQPQAGQVVPVTRRKFKEIGKAN